MKSSRFLQYFKPLAGHSVEKIGNWVSKHLHLASGGNFSAGQTFIAGEPGPDGKARPELVTVGGSGHVFNAKETAAMHGHGPVTVHQNIYGGVNNAADLARMEAGITSSVLTGLQLGVSG